MGVVAALHLYFLVLEMFFWAKPLGRRVFGLSADYAKSSRILAANQGLYNGFLAAGLVWGLALGAAGHPVIFFFLGCVIVAGDFRRRNGQPEDPAFPGAPRRGGDGAALALLTSDRAAASRC